MRVWIRVWIRIGQHDVAESGDEDAHVNLGSASYKKGNVDAAIAE
jgi:hypothetical protein